jgi:hypothetical protein
MIPISKECPYNECIYDVQSKVLAVIGKETKESFHMLPKLTDQGDVQYLKIGKRTNGKDYAEERKTLVTLYEYYVEDAQEVKDFVSMFCVNASTFNIQQYIDMVTDVAPTVAPSSLITTV